QFRSNDCIAAAAGSQPPQLSFAKRRITGRRHAASRGGNLSTTMPLIRHHSLSLRYRLLLPLLSASVLAAILVAALSALLGRQWALRDVQERFNAIEQTVRQANFPLTASVVASLASLSRTELTALDERGVVLASTLPLEANSLAALREAVAQHEASSPRQAPSSPSVSLQLAEQSFLLLLLQRHPASNRADRADRVVVLFDQAHLEAASRRAALLPLATGLSTVLLLTTLMIFMTGRLAGRLTKLQRGVERVASGDFDSLVSDSSRDEVGRLGHAIDAMSEQLRQLWQTVNRQQSQKLLHQIAGGMAHQLRNTLTGARLALELHRQTCRQPDAEEVTVALREMEVAEDYVHRLLLLGAGEQQPDTAAGVLACLEDVRSSQAAVSRHLRVQLSWEWDANLESYVVQDGPTFTAAISNLTLNAMQAATTVEVTARLLPGPACSVLVRDNGPGIAAALAEQSFEPFVTSKPEGMGLGLPLVRRAAEKLAGAVVWRREENRTCFEFRCKLLPAEQVPDLCGGRDSSLPRGGSIER
ncbi:MAG: HAMP domain-containing histidine kinase, partial [Planctomycetales bacterium]|nr:HAMP domain-containing histidine kinase [Planctomycetales bacterium]